MENKINIAELLKDCPKGMELDSTLFEGLEFDDIIDNDYLPIRCRIKNPKGGYTVYNFTKYGCWLDTTFSKCVIFPKGKTTWDGFHRPFKDGDILFYKHKSNNVKYIFIYKRRVDMHYLLQYCGWFSEKPYLSEQFNAKERMPLYENDDIRFATEEEKAKLFKAIKDNGYKWNPESNTLEKLSKFKVGDRIILKDNPHNIPSIRIKAVTKSQYILENEGFFYIDSTDEKYVLEDKFDINTLKPFDKVLVRTKTFTPVWTIDFYDGYRPNVGGSFTPFGVSGGKYFQQCIPYKGNEHLLGKTDDCSEFYKIWA